MKEKILLPSYDGSKNYIVYDRPTEDGLYVYNLEPASNFIRVIYDGTKIKSIDPSGGPFLSIGNKVDEMKLVKITSLKQEPIKLYFEHAENKEEI